MVKQGSESQRNVSSRVFAEFNISNYPIQKQQMTSKRE